MTDAHLRQLERDAAQGDLEARARLLLERMRVGDLSQERLELAAYLGDSGSLAALGHADEPSDIGRWTRGLSRWGRAAIFRVVVAGCRPALLDWGAQASDFHAALEDWIACPCPEHSTRTHAPTTADLSYASAWAGAQVFDAVETVGEQAVLRAIRSDVLPWVLGESDPVLERVEARQQTTP